MSAPADGYTILGASAPNMTAPFLMKGVRYNLLKDFIPISLAVSSPMLLIVKGDAPWQTLEEFIAEAKKKPGELTYAVPAYGSTAHFTGELFKMHTKTDLTCVPREGTGQVIPAVLGGHIHAFFPEVGIMQKYLAAGSLRALAVTSQQRHKDLPNVPTMAEKGFPDVVTSSWQSYLVRSETPREIVEKLGKAFKEGLKDKELIGTFEKMGFFVENYGPTEAAAFLTKDQQVKLEVIKAAKMAPQ
jgi:tripartite-type tricarboxylate transporter receptor subunit TctC